MHPMQRCGDVANGRRAPVSAILSAVRSRTCDRGADAESALSVNDAFSPRFSVRRRRHLRRELLVFCRAPDLYRCGSIADCSCNELVFTLTPAAVTCSKRRPQCVAVSLRRENIEVKLEPAVRFLKKWAKKWRLWASNLECQLKTNLIRLHSISFI